MSAANPARPEAGAHAPDAGDGPDARDVAARLRAELDRATAHLTAQQAEYDELLADPDVIQEDRDAAALLLDHARRALDAARTAVQQLDAGEYGRCATCGGPIGDERLAALVDVTTCVGCAG